MTVLTSIVPVDPTGLCDRETEDLLYAAVYSKMRRDVPYPNGGYTTVNMRGFFVLRKDFPSCRRHVPRRSRPSRLDSDKSMSYYMLLFSFFYEGLHLHSTHWQMCWVSSFYQFSPRYPVV